MLALACNVYQQYFFACIITKVDLPAANTRQGKGVHGDRVVKQGQECVEEWHGEIFLL